MSAAAEVSGQVESGDRTKATEITDPETKKIKGVTLKPSNMPFQIDLICKKDRKSLEPTKVEPSSDGITII